MGIKARTTVRSLPKEPTGVKNSDSERVHTFQPKLTRSGQKKKRVQVGR
jgi:hypothetical protein